MDDQAPHRFSGDVAKDVTRHWALLDEDLLAASSARRRAARAGKSEEKQDEALDGIRLGRRRAAMLEDLLVHAFDAALKKTGVTEPIALAAVGSFGRGAVALRSDLDVRLVTKDGHRRREAAAKVADAFLYPLWDAGLSVGHQVTSQSEALELAQADLATATTLLDIRTIAGDPALVRELVDRAYLGLFSEGELGRFVERLEEEATARHTRFGESLYLLEPEVKSGAGGLRDIDIARWAARARYRVGADPWNELVRLGVIVPREAQEMTRAEELLWQVRNRLHAHAGRKSDRLTFDQQETIAYELGYARKAAPPSEPSLDGEENVPSSSSPEVRAEAAERFMQDYFGHARVVSRSREALLLRVKPPKRRGKPVVVDLGNGVRLFDGQAAVDSNALLDEPALAFRVYDECIRHKAPLLPWARDLIARFAADPTWSAHLRESREAAKLFVNLLCTVPEAPLKRGSVVGELHEVGLLLAMIPEFQPVTGRVHHDVYHVYTVDVHSVAAVDCLRAICRGDVAHERPLASRLAAEIAHPIPLFVATLLHDVGKGYPDASGSRKNHSAAGAELCDQILPRLGLTAEDASEVRTLVASHLAMYHTATRRDLDDPQTTKDFCPQVHGREGLRNLYLLTVADITTTSPTAMTSWKARMLDELYFAADAHLAGASDTRDAARIERIRTQVLAGWSGKKADVSAFLQTMPERYLLANPTESIIAHAEVAVARTGAVHAALVPSRHPEVAELCVVADDAPGLLAKIAAAITAARLEVLGAQVYSRTLHAGQEARELGSRTGRSPHLAEAVDLFWVRDARGSADGVASALPRLLKDLEKLLGGEGSSDDLLRERMGSASPWRERPSPAVLSDVIVDDRASPSHTVVEVFAKDRPGLLFSLARAMHDLGLSIALSKINTEGTKVADVFYVNELDGAKVAPGARFKAIREALLDAARGGPEARESMRGIPVALEK